MIRSKFKAIFFFLGFSLAYIVTFQNCRQASITKPGWNEITSQTKPWTRWWWMGNALTKEGITAEMEAYQKAGIGGVEITPIYGVLGYEDKFVNFLSPEWMELLMHTLKEGERLGMGIDMATGTGWPFGGPWIDAEDACKNVNYKVYDLKGGESLNEKVEFIQPPYLRAVGNQIYEVHEGAAAEGRKVQSTRKEPVMRLDPKSLNIKDLVEPVSKNKNLQALALDQIQFEKPLPLQALIAYGDNGEHINITDKVDKAGKLNWVAPAGTWKLYAVFQGWHGKMVERAGPGGEGNVIDHFSSSALKNYLARFDSAFQSNDIKSLRAFFNDSYEVDDARGAADWTPELIDEFKKRRGYDLLDHLPALFGKDSDEKNRRVLSDYRQTIADLLLVNFTRPWKEWAHRQSAIVRNQAHGSPANILDLYATVDIPEIEGIEPLRIKMASSAGNVTGKKLVSSESATWLDEHFESNLGDIKIALDRFMLNGVNHIFYHGMNYSPPGETWPGWLFYAAVHLNPRNPQWKDFDALNDYVARCQSFLQNTQPDNDVLLYYPFYDRLATRGPEMIEHFDGIGRQFDSTPFEYAAEKMLEKGYAFDYISDSQIENTVYDGKSLKTEGNSLYQTLVIPHCQYMPLQTLKKIVSLVEQGATIIMLQGPPSSVAGFADLENNKRGFEELLQKIVGNRNSQDEISISEIGSGKVLAGDSLDAVLVHAKIRREPMTDSDIAFIRKKDADGNTIYFISNAGDEQFDGWIPMESEAETVILYDPMTGTFGKGKTGNDSGSNEVYVQLASKGTFILQVHRDDVEATPFRYNKISGTPVALKGPWKISFISGGPLLPSLIETDLLISWTDLEVKGLKEFSGSATYTISFSKPSDNNTGWLLDLGKVEESAEVVLNGKLLGTLIGPTYQVYVDPSEIKENNTLEITVSNLMANRISDMERQHVLWKKFYNVNFPARKAENRKNGLFDASEWAPRASGLLGPVQLLPVTSE